jgi:protein-S-isoprenylcysteine O-methyltransferase Ste14
MRYMLLVILWTAWCALHSAMISLPVTDWLRRRFPDRFRYYRIFYNLFAVVSLLPVLFYSYYSRGAPLVAWHGLGWIVPMVLWAAALFLFAAGGLRYDFLQFIGLRQIKNESACSVLTEDCSLDTGGVLSMVRHPWYTGGMLVVWARPLDAAAIWTNLVICGYFVVGAILEERKLKVHFGWQYEAYQRRVSMFLPIKWARRRFLGKS